MTTREIVISVDESIDPSLVESDLVDTTRLEKIVRSVLEAERVEWASVGIVLSGHERVRELNRDYLQHDYETDVLSFLIDETEGAIEGEVYVDVETAAERHQEFGTSIVEEIKRYVVHGVLHLAGHDDDTPEAKKRMNELENRYLESFG